MDKSKPASIEMELIDTRFELSRLPCKRREGELLSSISEMGIREPLSGILGDKFILLDGFKRLRCAQKLGINILPIEVTSKSEIDGIIKFLKLSNAKTLHILEQSKLVFELYSAHKMSVRDIANSVERSSSWVSVRLGFLKETPLYVQEQVFAGRFPAACAAYTLRQFKRLNKVKDADIEEFVKAVSGNKISKRDIDLLAEGYFKGGEQTREQIKAGNFSWITKLKSSNVDNDLAPDEEQIIRALEIVQKYMGRLLLKLPRTQIKTNSFKATAALLLKGALGKLKDFELSLKKFEKEVEVD